MQMQHTVQTGQAATTGPALSAEQIEGFQVTADAAENYERYLVPAIMRSWTPRLLALAEVRPGERVLDIACGTGLVAREAAAVVGEGGAVVGLDRNRDMLAVARRLPPVRGAPIEWREAMAESLPFETGAFAVVLCQNGLQFFQDRPAALREMRRVLAPGGRVALMVWGPLEESPAYAIMADALSRHLGDEAASVLHSPFALHDPAELRRLLEDAGFGSVAVHIGSETGRFPSLATFVSEEILATLLLPLWTNADMATQAVLVDEVRARLRPYADGDALAFPMQGHLALARA
jgi:ubiquinone/menaquinone biosynthesis C-methylase UbiE